MLGHWTYLVSELAWALPVIALQWTAGWPVLWAYRRVILVSVALPSIYLSAADSVAIGHGIWSLHASRIVGLRVGNVPLEEIVFFLLTDVLVVQSVVLLAHVRREGVKIPLRP